MVLRATKNIKIYDKRIRENRFIAYLKNVETNEYVGYVNYHFAKDNERYECGIVIQAKHRVKGYAKEGLKLLCKKAKEDGINSLYDNFEKDRQVIKVFLDLGFEIVEETTWKKFLKDVVGIVVKKELNEV